MPKTLTAEDILPLVASLSDKERARLLKLIATKAPATDDAAAYRQTPPKAGEFDSDEEPLSWDADGWEGLQ